MKLHVVLFCVLLFSTCTYAARILVVLGLCNRSHKNLAFPLSETLAKRGNEVVFVSVHPSTKKVANITEITLKDVYNDNIFPNMFEQEDFWTKFNTSINMMPEIIAFSGRFLRAPEIQQLYSSNQEFDAVVVGGIFADYAYILAHRFRAHLILISSMTPFASTAAAVGNPFNPSVDPDPMLGYRPPMTFFQRVLNTISTVAHYAMFKYYLMPKYNAVTRQVFGEDVPCLNDLKKNTSLILVNDHFGISHPKPNLPAIVDIAGINCHPAKPLPKDLEEWVSGSGEHGFIYVSFGTLAKGDQMPEFMKEAFVKALGQLPQRVLMKWENDTMKDMPANVKLGKWFPQNDLLGHPKIQLFITHGGLFSTLEAIYHGVPVVGTPIFGDQEMNMINTEASGWGLKVDLPTITADKLLNAIKRVLTDPSFRKNVQQKSVYLRDQETSPADHAAYWVEYVIRHNGAAHMRSRALSLSWYQYHLIDVIAFISLCVLATTVISIFVTVKLWRLIKRCICGKNKNKVE